ncbi:uncharacterized protein LOC113140904 [Mastacembelus armatus]|uniref:uncharacterized protein LOC113140904 n=1 Tax=Mastacembelus armatus TaxID=205130 RepID=UPI000E4645AD|nr:uncharacterized protein LOC113140904 [Mastacembelus armatus]
MKLKMKVSVVFVIVLLRLSEAQWSSGSGSFLQHDQQARTGSIVMKTVYFVLAVTAVASTSPEPQELKVHPGQDAVLHCLTPKPTSPSLLVWVRPDLEDPEMKDGDISVILKNVTFTDSGRYECQTGDGSTEDGPRLICTIILKVEHSGHTGGHKDGGVQGGHVGLAVGLPVVAVVLLVAAVVGLMFYRKHQSQRSREQVSVQQPVDGETV